MRKLKMKWKWKLASIIINECTKYGLIVISMIFAYFVTTIFPELSGIVHNMISFEY